MDSKKDFTKIFSENTISKLNTFFGNLNIFENKRVFHSAIVCTKASNLDDLYIINKNEYTPKFPEDWFMFCSFRALTESSLQSGAILRNEVGIGAFDPPNFGEYKDLEEYFFYGENMITKENIKKKGYLIMSKTLTPKEIKSLEIFNQKHIETFIQENPILNEEFNNPSSEFVNFLRDHNIQIIDNEFRNAKEALDYLLNVKKYRSVLVELGTTLTNPFYEDESLGYPVEVLMLTVYDGKVLRYLRFFIIK